MVREIFISHSGVDGLLAYLWSKCYIFGDKLNNRVKRIERRSRD